MDTKKERFEELRAAFEDALNKPDHGLIGDCYDTCLEECREFRGLCWELFKELPDNHPGFCEVESRAEYLKECFEDMEAEAAAEDEDEDEEED